MANAQYIQLSPTNRDWVGVAIANNKLYASIDASGSIYEIDKSTGNETLVLSQSGQSARGLGEYKGAVSIAAVSGLACRAYTAPNFTTASYTWANSINKSVVCICSDGTNAYGLKWAQSSNQLLVMGADGSVVEKTTVSATRNCSGIVYLGGLLYACDQNSGVIYKINPSTGAETGSIANVPSKSWRGITTDGTYLYSCVASGRIWRINPNTGYTAEISGDSADRAWIGITYENGCLYAIDLGGRVWKITLPNTVTATYTYPSTTQRNWFGLAEINGTLYSALNTQGIYSVNKTTGGVTAIYSENAQWRGIAAVGGNLLCAQTGGLLKLISTSGTLIKNFGTDAWEDCCSDPADSNVAYAICWAKGATNQLAKLNISAGTVQYFTTTNREYTGIVCLGDYLYASVNAGFVYKINKSTFTETVFCNETRDWRESTTDGTYLYFAVSSGQIRRVDPSTGVSEIVLGDPAGDNTSRGWTAVEYSPTDNAIWATIYQWELWKLALPIPAVPTASPTTSTIYSDTSVTLSCATSGATIKYTTDGSTPGLSNGTTYSAPFTVSKTTTIKFCAIKDGYLTAGADVVLTWAPIFTQLTSITGSEFQWTCIAYYNGVLYGVLYDNAVVETIDPTLYSINPTTGALTSLATLASVPFAKNMVIGGDKIYIIGNAGKNVREYNLSGTLLNTYVCDPGTELTGLNGITYLNGKVYAFSGTSYPKSYFFEITPGNTTVNTISYTGTFSQYCNGQTWTDGTYIYYPSNYNVYRVNPTTGATTLVGTVSNQSINSRNDTYLNGSLIVRVGFLGSDTLGVCNSSESYSLFRPFPNPNNIEIWNMTNDGTYIYGASGTGTAKIYKIRAFLDLGTPSIYNSGSWKTENALYVRHNSAWQAANKAFKVKNGLWTRIY